MSSCTDDIDSDRWPKYFSEGVWARWVFDPATEKKILEKREKLSYCQLWGCKSDGENDLDYTSYSPSTFIHPKFCVDLPVDARLTRPTQCGVLIRTLNNTGEPIPTDFWDCEMGGRATDDFTFSENEISPKSSSAFGLFSSKLKDSRNPPPTPENIAQQLEKYLEANPQSESQWTLPGWNEGLLRYKKEDICGFFVSTTPDHDAEKFLKFAKEWKQELGLSELPIYEYKMELQKPPSLKKIT
mmetsp:Transcript_14700/g.21960  ORF Transcript_14700/g.21960 Transcript_14700/m.21960 type:complete len:242 (+) Transcript_14700:92-817(+)